MSNINEEMIECDRGMLLSQTKDGDYVPFFIQCREEDILWDTDTPKEWLDAINNAKIVTGSMVAPQSLFVGKTESDSHNERWGITIGDDMHCRLSKRIWIDSSFVHVTGTNKVLHATIDLPVKISASRLERFSMNVIKSFNNSYYTSPIRYVSINCIPK